MLCRSVAAIALSTAVATSVAATANAQDGEPVKIGFMATMSGPPGILGKQLYDGFKLALDEADNTAGGRPIEVILVDDELKPDYAVTKAQELVQRDEVDFVAGVVFSNILMAIFRPVTESETFLIGANAGTSTVAGRRCSPFFFNVSWQNDQIHEVMGKYAQDQGLERVFLLAPNYQAGRDSVAGFERHYSGEVVDTVYTPLNNLDFSAELARIASAEPDALFTFMPGGMGVNLVKQFQQAGLADKITFLSAFTVDEGTMQATKDDALGLFGSSQWAQNLDVPGNAEFVENFKSTYDYLPSHYTAQGYDAGLLILDAVNALDGDLSDKDAVRKALAESEFQSVRGDFSFNTNQFPIQDFYLTKAVKTDDGNYVMEAVEKVFDDYGDVYAAECSM
ncbi:MAG: ABC transporter substrate-binding protein [Pseudomonadota bacterium]